MVGAVFLHAAVICLVFGRVTASRIVSVADLHGDWDHALRVLQAAGLIDVPVVAEVLNDPNGRPFARYQGVTWVGGNTTLVQTGDIVDRGTFSRDLYALFAELRRQAPAAGGRVVNLIGNHELLNMEGLMHYGGAQETQEYGGLAQRLMDFAPDGWIGRQLFEEFDAVFEINGTVFVHAGVPPEYAKHGVHLLNQKVREMLKISFRAPVFGEFGPFWLRQYAMGLEAVACPRLVEALKLLGAQRMVIGHTPQLSGEVRTRCGDQLVLADTVMSKSGYGNCWETGQNFLQCRGALNFVEILDGKVQAVHVDEDDGEL